MHNLAISLRRNGHIVTGSDDEIFEPALTLLKNEGLLPDSIGWDANRVHNGLDAVILGMHAKKDNPELLKAQELGIEIYSFPAFVAKQIQDKKRVVIGGSHGKTTTTSMLTWILEANGLQPGFLVGGVPLNFGVSARLGNGDCFVIEADESDGSFLHYQTAVALITNVDPDHLDHYGSLENFEKESKGSHESVQHCCTCNCTEELGNPIAKRIGNVHPTCKQEQIESSFVPSVHYFEFFRDSLIPRGSRMTRQLNHKTSLVLTL